MNDTMLGRHAMTWKRVRVALSALAIVGSGDVGLASMAGLLTLAIIGTIGRKSSWRFFRTLGPQRKPDAAS